MEKKKVVLVVIYNHRYDKNIPVIENIYRHRFSTIFHIVPFYDGDRSNVIPVYENSRYFQGYIAQAYPQLVRSETNHYFFIADDMTINPAIDENTFYHYFPLSADSGFLPNFTCFHQLKRFWNRTREAYRYRPDVAGTEATGELPDPEEALYRLQQHGLSIGRLQARYIYRPLRKWNDVMGYKNIGWRLTDPIEKIQYAIRKHVCDKENRLKNIWKEWQSQRGFHLNYPLVGAYSDIFVIPERHFRLFCHYCGVFAATRLFVEIAIPTAMALSIPHILTEKDISLQGKALWTEDDMKELAPYEKDLNRLLSAFPPEKLYYHPVKLSQWKK